MKGEGFGDGRRQGGVAGDGRRNAGEVVTNGKPRETRRNVDGGESERATTNDDRAGWRWDVTKDSRAIFGERERTVRSEGEDG